MRKLYCTVLFVVLATSSSRWHPVKAKHIPHDEVFQQTYGNIPIGDPSKDYDIDIGAPLNEADLAAYNNTFAEGSDVTLRNSLRVDPIEMAGLYEGDIIINSRQELDKLSGRSAVSYTPWLWRNSTIPYTIASSFGPKERSLIAKAMEGFHKKTCIKFVPRKRQREYIKIYKGKGCSSSVGRVYGGQSLSLASPGCIRYGIILHELMHAAGFWHEQSRTDRDEYVTIFWDNIQEGQEKNFNKSNKHSTTGLGLPYDYNSLMHYTTTEFAKDKRYPTIVSKPEGTRIGNRRDFSKLDLEGLNLLYKC